jgi:hypothetical protein
MDYTGNIKTLTTVDIAHKIIKDHCLGTPHRRECYDVF